MWVYPYEDDIEHIRYNVVNGILLRPYISGLVWNLSEEGLAALREGIDVYKEIRGRIPSMVPLFPLGFSTINSPVMAYGLREKRTGGSSPDISGNGSPRRAYLSVFTPLTDTAEIPLTSLKRDGSRITGVRVLYPRESACEYSYDDMSGVLKVKMPHAKCARLFEVTTE